MPRYRMMQLAAFRLGAGLLACASPLLGSHAAASEGRSENGRAENNRAIVTAAFDRWAAGGTNFFGEILSPEIVWTIEGSGPSAGTYRGLADFNARAIRPFVSRLKGPVRPGWRRIWADGDHVIIHWEGEAVARDGRAYRNRYAWIFKMADGKAVEVHAFLDLEPYDDVIRRVSPAGDSGE